MTPKEIEVHNAVVDAAAKIARGELRNTAFLMSSPPQSAAAWDIANQIEKLRIKP